MTNDIVEAGQPMGTAAAVIEKKARQLVYDARYEVKGKLQGKKVEPVVLERMVLQQIAKSKAIPAVIARARQMISKKSSVKEEYISEIQESATNSVANALYKVFVEGVQKEEIHLNYLEELAASPDKKYKIRVTDPKTNNSYVRFATREKITELRGKGLKVELTEYGEPREGERKRGEDTARATGGGGRKKLDPVGREDADVDNDGKRNDSNDKYIMKRRAAIGAAIEKKKTVSASYEPDGDVLDEAGGRHGGGSMVGKPGGPAPRNLPGNQEKIDANKNGQIDANDFRLLRAKRGKVEEEFLTDGTTSVEGQNKKQITGNNVDNSSLIKVMPQDGSDPQVGGGVIKAGVEFDGPFLTEKAKSKAQQAFMGMVYARKKGKMKKGEASPEVEAAARSMTKKEAKKFAKTKHKGLPEKVTEAVVDNKDPRDDKAYREVIKNKFRALGAKNPMVVGNPEDLEKTYNKIATSDMIKGKEGGMCEGLVTGTAKAINAVLKPVGQTPEEGKAAVQNLTRNMDVVAKPVKSAIKAALSVGPEKNQQMLNKRRPTAAQAARMENVESKGKVVEQVRRGTDYLGRDAGGSEEEHASNVRFGKRMKDLQGAVNPKPGNLSNGLVKPAN